MSRPIVASAHNVKRSASAPYAGMPFGNCLRVFFSMRSRRCGCIRPLVRLATSASRSMPSIRSSGSMMLPFDLDILSPCSSRISPVM